MSRFLFFLFYTASQGDQNKSALCINYHIQKLYFEKVLFTSKKPKFMICDMLPESSCFIESLHTGQARLSVVRGLMKNY